MLLFKRRDTRVWALTMGGMAAVFCLCFAMGTPDWRPVTQGVLALAGGIGVGGLICRHRRHLPPDVDLQWIDPAEAQRLAQAGAPPGHALLFVSFAADWGARHRLDVLIDGEQVGQLRPGTGFLLPLRPGLRRMTAFLDRPQTTVSETVNSFPGGYAGFVVRKAAGRAIQLSIQRGGAAGPVIAPPMRLVRPAIPEV